MTENKSVKAEMQQNVNLLLSTYYNLYGCMPSTQVLSSQLGIPCEASLNEWIRKYSCAMPAMAS